MKNEIIELINKEFNIELIKEDDNEISFYLNDNRLIYNKKTQCFTETLIHTLKDLNISNFNDFKTILNILEERTKREENVYLYMDYLYLSLKEDLYKEIFLNLGV